MLNIPLLFKGAFLLLSFCSFTSEAITLKCFKYKNNKSNKQLDFEIRKNVNDKYVTIKKSVENIDSNPDLNEGVIINENNKLKINYWEDGIKNINVIKNTIFIDKETMEYTRTETNLNRKNGKQLSKFKNNGICY